MYENIVNYFIIVLTRNNAVDCQNGKQKFIYNCLNNQSPADVESQRDREDKNFFIL
jgi:hypothetical protein